MRRAVPVLALLMVVAFPAGSPQALCEGPGAAAQASCCSRAGGFCGCARGKVRCCNGQVALACPCRGDAGAE